MVVWLVRETSFKGKWHVCGSDTKPLVGMSVGYCMRRDVLVDRVNLLAERVRVHGERWANAVIMTEHAAQDAIESSLIVPGTVPQAKDSRRRGSLLHLGYIE